MLLNVLKISSNESEMREKFDDKIEMKEWEKCVRKKEQYQQEPNESYLT